MHDKCMVVKTITIDLNAYELLKRRKREGQSFSQVIKEHFDAPKTGRDLSTALGEVAFSDQALEALDQLVKSRRQDAARTVEL